MKTLNQIIKEATREINELPRRSKAFVDKHVVQKMDYPVDVEDQFTAKKLKKDKTKLASFHDGEDASVYEEVDLEEGVSNLSDARLKFHVLKDVPHGSYTKKEMSAEHLRRKKTGGPAYNAVKPSLNEEVELGEAQVKKPTSYERAVALPDGEPDKSAEMGVDKAAYAAASAAAKPKSQVSLKKASWDMKKEEAELDEAKTDVYHKHMLKALGKSRLPKDHPYTSSIANNGDFVVRKGSEIAGRIPKGEHNLKEASMTPTDMKQREDIVKGMKKNTQDFKDRYGSKWKSVMYATATKAAMKEESEQIDELSNEKKMAYGNAAFADYHKQSKSKLTNILTGKDSSGESRKMANRVKGISRATKTEEVELDEISRDLARRYIRKVSDKKNTGEASPKEVMKRSAGVALAGKKAYDIGGKARVNATESVESSKYDVPAKKKPVSMMSKDEKDKNDERRNAYKDYQKSLRKESVELDEAFKAGKMKLNDGSSVTLTSESSNSLNNLFNQLSSPNKTKMEQRLMSGSKGFNEILAFAKEV